MKKKINNIPKNKFGAADITNIGSTVTSIANTGIQAAQDSKENGANVGKAFVTSLGTSFQGFQTGMTVGGPIGGIVGGVAGGLAGLIPGLLGRKGSVDTVTGEITTPSGIKGWRGPSIEDLRDRSRQIKRNNAFRNFNNTAAYEYYQDNGYNDYTMVANGGIIPNALAYVDDGELLRTPDGKIIDIPEQGKPTDSNLVSVPEGTQVLSDKLKVPGTKETFAEAGKRIMKKQKYGNDKYAKNSEMLNNANNQIAYDNLLNLQENMKNKKGIKEKIGKYSPGTRSIRNVKSTADYATDIYGTEPYIDSMISGLSSIVANLTNAKDTKPEPVYPRYARAYFGPVEYDINPLLAEINRANAIARYNETELAPRTGANLAYGIQAAVARNKAINDAYYNQSNINNQTRARNAQMASNTSQFNARAQHTADVEYAQNRAAARNLRRKYRSANATIIPSMLRDIRQNRRDQALLEFMKPFIEYGSTDEAFANLKRGMR